MAGIRKRSHNDLKENMTLSSLSMEEVSCYPNSQSLPLGDPDMDAELQQQLGSGSEHCHNNSNGNIQLQDQQFVVDNSNQAFSYDHSSNWDAGMQDPVAMGFNHHHHNSLQQQQRLQEAEMQSFDNNSSSSATPGLLNLLHLRPNSYAQKAHNDQLSLLGESASVYDPLFHLNLPPQPPLFTELFHHQSPLAHQAYSLPVSLFGGVDEREVSGGGGVLDFGRERDAACKGRDVGKCTKHFATERQRDRKSVV